MYQNRQSSFRGRSNGPARSFGGKPHFGNRGGGGRGGGRQGRTEKIDFARFINKVVVTEEAEVFTPEHSFQDLALLPLLKQGIVTKGYSTPTPIQDRAIPHVLLGHDVVGIANTGTGKTATFLIPLINKVLNKRQEQIMIIVPTRELAIQIDEELADLSAGMKIFSVC